MIRQARLLLVSSLALLLWTASILWTGRAQGTSDQTKQVEQIRAELLEAQAAFQFDPTPSNAERLEAAKAQYQVIEPPGSDASVLDVPPTMPITESEPNNTVATADPIPNTTCAVVNGNINPGADLDFFSFSGTAGNRVYIYVRTSFSNTGNNSIVRLINTDGVTLIEGDNDDGAQTGLSSSIAGATLPGSGTFFIAVSGSPAAATITPYQMEARRISVAPTAETEPNNSAATADPLPASQFVSGTCTMTDVDFFKVFAHAGNRIWASLDLDPERNGGWNGVLQLLAPDGTTVLFTANSSASVGTPAPPSESFSFDIPSTGIYFLRVSVNAAGVGSTYHLQVCGNTDQVMQDDQTSNCVRFSNGTFCWNPSAGPNIAGTITSFTNDGTTINFTGTTASGGSLTGGISLTRNAGNARLVLSPANVLTISDSNTNDSTCVCP